MNNRHAHSRGIIAVLGGSLLAATAASADDVTVWAWDPNFNGAAMELAAERYKADHPDFNMVYEEFAREEIEAKLQTQLAAGTTEGLPDIVLIEDYSAQKFLLSFPGAFEPLGDTLDYSRFADYKVELATVNGETYSVPFDSGVSGLFYRSDILEEAGFGEEDLQDITWSEYVEIAKVVAEETGMPMLTIDYNDTGLFSLMMQSAGDWFFNEDGSLNLVGNENFRAAVEAYTEIVQNPEIYKTINGWSEYTGALTGGDVASTITGVWITGTIKAAEMPGQWAVAPTPRLDIDSSINASNLGGSSWYVLASSDNMEETKDFLSTIWGNDVEFYQEILVNQGAVGSLLEVREGEAYQSSDDYFGGQPVWQMFSEWLAEIPGVNYGIFTYEVRSAITSNVPAMADGADVDTVIENIAAEAAVLTQ
ncbi:ABC transporter substrate-binding protein [Pelagovum pacificum]|uniref:Extracellular solute-binding protein n=1 Tax=Pelagovum pacificum TaxID=2588711 RepID=A0A5C5GFL7_9RHOB|nr:extracellular solute-binding protein [Pelagovum pacificum]QQA43864.1 extracellular solute-binding protein [Pelagovum pacificum]TNY33004.1 extracellular solute-binding protein [Pelagovum pacificum]